MWIVFDDKEGKLALRLDSFSSISVDWADESVSSHSKKRLLYIGVLKSTTKTIACFKYFEEAQKVFDEMFAAYERGDNVFRVPCARLTDEDIDELCKQEFGEDD